MSLLRLDDDLFSPVRFDVILGENSDSSEESLNDHSHDDEFALTDSVKNKVASEKFFMKSVEKSKLESNDGNIESESVSTCLNKEPRNKSECVSTSTHILIQNSNDRVNAKGHFSELKLEKIKDHKRASEKKENTENQQKKQEILYRKKFSDSNTPKFDRSDKLHQKKSRPTSLLLKNESTKQDSLKDIKKKQQATNQSLKSSSVGAIQKSNFKLPADKKLTGNSSNSLESSIKELDDSSVLSIESKENASKNSLENEKSGSGTEEIENLNMNPLHSSYEETIKKMIHSSICSEWTKIRQLMYMQQISFYREINKIKDEIEKQHLATTERLFKVIEELMRMNASLRALSNKD